MATDLPDARELLAQIRDQLAAGFSEGLDAGAAAAMLGVSRSKFFAMSSSGQIPQPIELGTGRCPRWSRSELLAWFRAGAPPRVRWEHMRASALRGIA